MIVSKLKATLAAQLRNLALSWGRKAAEGPRGQQSWESMDAMLALANEVAVVPDTQPALLDVVFLPPVVSDSAPVAVPDNVLLRAYSFTLMQEGGVDTFLNWVAHTMCVKLGKLA